MSLWASSMKLSFFSRLFGKSKRLKPNPLTASKTTRSAPLSPSNHYDLSAIYQRLNADYFADRVQAEIIWFGDASRSVSTRRLLGAYHLKKKVIKIHRLLDHPDFPPYFISFVVYHEMLHSLFPPLQERNGKRKIHHAAFKEQERRFSEYALAKEWEKQNFKLFFKKRDYGRS